MAKNPGSGSSSDQPDDVVTATLLRLWKQGQQNTQALVVAGVVLAVTLGAAIYYYNYQQNLQMQAAREYEQIRRTVGSGETESAVSELQTFLDRFEGTSHAAEARLVLADLHLRQDRAGEAVSVLEPATGNLSDPLSRQAAFLLATAHEQAGRIEEAETVYLRIADEADLSFQIRRALADAARLRAQEGDYSGAADLYERVLATYDDDAGSDQAASDNDRQIYQLRLAEMRAAQGNG